MAGVRPTLFALLVPEALRVKALARIDRYEVEDAATVRAIPGAAALLGSLPPHKWAVVTSARTKLARARIRAPRACLTQRS